MAQCPSCRAVNPDSQSFCGTCGSRLSGSDAVFSPTLTIDSGQKFLAKGSLFAGKYKIENEIGRGGMGIVFKAQDTHLRRTVALKFLPSELAVRPEAKERFLREARAAAALDHPNICTIHEAEEATGLAYIAMAYVEGRTLSARIAQGAIPPDEALEIALQTADGLAEAHRKGILHRDIKSSNIMLREKGQAKIMDFGLAKVSGDTALTKESRTMGTISYMSPEQARGEEVDARTDVWSLGVVIYEILAGHLPFRAEYDQAVIHAILHENPKPVRKLITDLPESFSNVVGKALSKDRDNRYASAEEMLADLRRVKEGLTVAASRQGLFAGRRKVAWAAGAGLLLLLAASLFLLTSKGSAKIYDTIAVMPFVMSGSEPGQEDISDGLTDEVIQRLCQVAALRVKATAAVLPYKNNPKSIKEMGRELGVKALVMSRITQPAGMIRISVELVDAETESVLWRNIFEGNRSDYIVLQSSMAQDVIRNIRVQLTQDEQARLAKSRKVSPEAYKKYLKALQYGINELYSQTANEKALLLAKEAIALEPEFVKPYSLMLTIYENQLVFNLRSFKELIGPIRETIGEILRLDPDSADGYAARAAEYSLMYRWKDALEMRAKAVQLAPGDNLLRLIYAFQLGYLGYTQLALEECKRIQNNDPDFQTIGYVSVILSSGRKFDEAIALILDFLRTNPKSTREWWNLSWAYGEKRMPKEALEAFHKTEELLKAEGSSLSLNFTLNEPYYLAIAGEREKALARIAELAKSPERKVLGAGFDFCVATILGLTGDARDREEAFRYLELSTLEFHPWSVLYGTEPFLDPLRSDPRFAKIIKKVGFPIE